MYDPQSWETYLGAAMADAGVLDYADLSRRTGLGESRINKWFSRAGHRRPQQPSTHAISALSRVLNTSVADLLVETGHFTRAELPLTSSELLDHILDSGTLTDKEKLALVRKWRLAERELASVQRETVRVLFERRQLPPAGMAEPA